MELRISSNSLYAFYDLSCSPVTLDFTTFMACANAYRLAKGLAEVHVLFVPDVGSGFRERTERDIAYDVEKKRWRLYNLLMPVSSLVPECRAITMATNREIACSDWLLHSQVKDNVFPPGYDPQNNVIAQYMPYYIRRCADAGWQMQSFQAPSYAREMTEQWLSTHCQGKIPVSITLRNSDFHPQRNSNLAEWGKALARLDTERYWPVIIRDSDSADKALPSSLSMYTCFDLALYSIPMRMALYESCALNLFVSQGTAHLAYFSQQCSFLVFKILNPAASTANEEFLIKNGFIPGEQMPFFNETQRFVWEDDSADAIVAAFDDVITSAETKYLAQHPQLGSPASAHCA